MKVSIIGAGNVGATAAMKIASETIIDNIVLLDVKEGVAEGKAMDIMQSLMMVNNTKNVLGTTGDYSKTANSDIIVITSGVPRKPGMTREELVGVNSKVMTMVMDGCTKYSPNAIYIVVSNPMDTMTQMVVNYLGVENANRVIGMGGILDSARFKYNIYMKLKEKTPANYMKLGDIYARVIGGHGDTTMIPMVYTATMFGKPITEYLTEEEINDVVEKTMKGGATLTKLLGTSAWEAPAQGICETVKMITLNKNTTVSASVYHDTLGLCIGDTVTIGATGITSVHYEGNDPAIRDKFDASVNAVKNVNAALS